MRSSGYDELDIDRDDPVAFDAAADGPDRRRHALQRRLGARHHGRLSVGPRLERPRGRHPRLRGKHLPQLSSVSTAPVPPGSEPVAILSPYSAMQQTGIAHPYLDAAREILPEVIALRRRLHRVPEVGLELPADPGARPRAPSVGSASTRRRASRVGSVVATIEGAGPARRSCCAPTWTRCR